MAPVLLSEGQILEPTEPLMLSRIVNRLEEGFIALFLGCMVLITFRQVVARSVFNSGAVWALALTTYLFAWLVLIGASSGVQNGAHLGVAAFFELFPEGYQHGRGSWRDSGCHS